MISGSRTSLHIPALNTFTKLLMVSPEEQSFSACMEGFLMYTHLVSKSEKDATEGSAR